MARPPGVTAPVRLLGSSDRHQHALLFTTNPGLEDIVADECIERLAGCGIADPEVDLKPYGYGGHTLVFLSRMGDDVRDAALHMRSVHHVLRPLYVFDMGSPDLADPLGRMYDELSTRGVQDLEDGRAFRVTTRRTGEHPFSSIDIQRRAGAAFFERYACPVDLTDYAHNVRVDVIDSTCVVGVQLTGKSLSRRHQRLYNPRAALKANVAYGLIRLAELDGHSRTLLDPFCGSGTILQEAAQVWPLLEIQGSDFAEEAVRGARENAEVAGLSARIAIQRADARHLEEIYPDEAFDAIVTNPPFGVRLGRGLDFYAFYRQVLQQCARVLVPGGRLVLLARKRGVLDRINRELRLFRRLHYRVIETGGIYPRAYVYERR